MSRVIVHMSDVHFGRADGTLVEPLIAAVHRMRPDVVVVSGDLTQRARVVEFEQARNFLCRLPDPKIVIPGNHDVPLFNVYGRFAQPLARFRKYISTDIEPEFVDDELAVVSINTARSLTWKGGRIGYEQIGRVRDRLREVSPHLLRVLVTHHPFDVPAGLSGADVVGRARMAMSRLADCNADIVLSGHLHISHVGASVRRYSIAGHSALLVQAGTAISTRSRGETNAFNRIRVSADEIELEVWHWLSHVSGFVCRSYERFCKAGGEWRRSVTEV